MTCQRSVKQADKPQAGMCFLHQSEVGPAVFGPREGAERRPGEPVVLVAFAWQQQVSACARGTEGEAREPIASGECSREAVI